MSVRGRPVFLHTGWRTAGTWLWSAFRSHDDVLGLYEPLNQSLATLTLSTLPMMRPAASNSRHPEEQRPYFEEFAPLMSLKGVAGYRPDFAYETFFMERTQDYAELRGYVESLIALGDAEGKTLVFKFCRTLGRVGWMRHTFPEAAHIFVMRDPRSQWLSAWRLSRDDDNPHHLLTPVRILTRHRDHRLVAPVLAALCISSDDFTLPAKHAAVRKAVRKTPSQTLYRGFLAFWLLTAFLAFPDCDLTVETERLSDVDYRLSMHDAIRELTGVSVDLGDAHQLSTLGGANDFFGARQAHADALRGLAVLQELEPNRGEAVARLIREKLSEPKKVQIAI